MRDYLSFRQLLLVATCFFIACSGSQNNSSNEDSEITVLLRQLDADRYIGASWQTVEDGNGNWEKYHFGTEACRCLDGSDYWVSARDEGSSNVILFMSGGGACWPGSISCSQNTAQGVDISSFDGFWLTSDPVNPLAGWNAVYLPYCDGSLFAGDNYADYDNDGNPDYYHWGLRNISAGVTVMKELFPDAEKILISGMSGGGYGTIAAYAVVRLQYPDAEIFIFNDSGPGLYNPDLTDTFDLIKTTWGIDTLIPETCPECRDQLAYMYSWYLMHDPQLRIGLFSFYQDFVIAQEFLDMEQVDFETLLLDVTGQIKNRFPERFARFFIQGNCHTLAKFCPEGVGGIIMDYEVEGTSVYQWIGGLVNSEETGWGDLLE